MVIATLCWFDLELRCKFLGKPNKRAMPILTVENINPWRLRGQDRTPESTYRSRKAATLGTKRKGTTR